MKDRARETQKEEHMTHRDEQLLTSWAGTHKPSLCCALLQLGLQQELPKGPTSALQSWRHKPPGSSVTASSQHSHILIGTQLVQEPEKFF